MHRALGPASPKTDPEGGGSPALGGGARQGGAEHLPGMEMPCPALGPPYQVLCFQRGGGRAGEDLRTSSPP